MQRTLFLMSLAFGAMLLTAHMAGAQGRNCADHAAVVERLAVHYKESRQVLAQNGGNGVLEVFASTETGTWTITITRPDGLTCIVAAGDNYQFVADSIPISEKDA